VNEQIIQPYIHVSVTLYLHFHVANPTFEIVSDVAGKLTAQFISYGAC